MPHPALSVANLSVRFGDHQVLHDVSFTVAPGEVYALLGGNGAGKSTTIAALLGLIAPAGGSVAIDGIDPIGDPPRARSRVAYVPENVALYDHLSAVENAEYFLALARQPATRDAITDALDRAGLQRDAHDRRLAGFSKGMRQKVAIGIALLREVPALVLDEPTSGLDPSASADFHGLIGGLRDRGVGVLMVTHDLLGAADVADRIGILAQGRIVREERPADGPDRYDLGALHRHFVREAA